MVNQDLISPKQLDYVMGILDLILEHQPHDQSSVNLSFFCVIAALSERVTALVSTSPLQLCLDEEFVHILSRVFIVFEIL